MELKPLLITTLMSWSFTEVGSVGDAFGCIMLYVVNLYHLVGKVLWIHYASLYWEEVYGAALMMDVVWINYSINNYPSIPNTSLNYEKCVKTPVSF